MSGLVVTVRFAGDPALSDAALSANPELRRAVESASERHGLRRSTRLIGDGVYMDIDEWDTPEDRDAFVAELRDVIVRWNALAGVSSMASELWRPATPDEDF